MQSPSAQIRSLLQLDHSKQSTRSLFWIFGRRKLFMNLIISTLVISILLTIFILDNVQCTKICHNGRYIATCSEDTTVKVICLK